MRKPSVAFVVTALVALPLAVGCGDDTPSATASATDVEQPSVDAEPVETTVVEPSPTPTTPDPPATETPPPPTMTPSPNTSEPLQLADGERLFFQVELVVTDAAPTTPWTVGDVLERCYTIDGDGTFLNPGFPQEGAPGEGTWERVDDDPGQFTARVEALPLVLEMSGTIGNGSEGNGSEEVMALTADVVVSAGGASVLTLTSQGVAVDACPV